MTTDPGDPTPPARLRALVSWQVSRIGVLATRLTAQHMAIGDRSDFAVLAALEEFGAMSQADLGRRLGLDRNDVNRIVTRLEADARLSRATDATNRRRNIVTLTDAGRAHLESIQHSTDALQDELLAGLTPAQRTQLQALLAEALDHHRPQSS